MILFGNWYYMAMGGQIIDASIVSVPTQHNKPPSEREKQGNKTL